MYTIPHNNSYNIDYSFTHPSMITMKENTNSVFYVGSVIAAAAILITAGITGSALFITPQQVIASIEDTT